ncbi:MAG: replication initiator protein [Microvirus sp.]|nr:MAG: replication initiator protein [Microvirus sp.]
MPCYNPLQAVQGADPLTGEWRVSFRVGSTLLSAKAVEVPCGQCIGCRISRARGWALRCLHEARLYTDNSFLTLTYAPEHLPESLRVRDLQLFFKRLRYFSERKFRYYAVGEYGTKLSRPHYHCLLFGFDFPDKKLWKGTGANRLYRSELLERAWPFGHALIGSVTTESAQYVAKYSVKQVRGKRAKEHYGSKAPEFAVMSRRPGIGAGWIDQYESSVFPRDFVVVPGGRKVAVPRYYLGRFGGKEVEGRVEAVEAIQAARAERNRPADVLEALARRPAIAKFVAAREKHFNERSEVNEDASLRGIR